MKVAVIGAGTMGTGLVQLFAAAEFIGSILWVSRSVDSLNMSYQKLRDRYAVAVKKGKMSVEALESCTSKISISDNFEDLCCADFIIEAVAEDIEVKKNIFEKASKHINPNSIFASNTSSLSITEISSVARYKDNVIGLHFFNPAPVMKLTEVVLGFLTSSHAKDFVFDFATKLGKKPVIVNEAPGFVVNRMLIPMINEAIAVYAEGVASASDIDAAMINGANHPIGPLSLADLIGNDICLSIMEVLHKETGDPKYRAHPLLRKMVRAGKLGRKCGQGFFSYKSEGAV